MGTRSGSTVTLQVCVKNNSGISGFDFDIKYDKADVTPVSISNGIISVTSKLQQTTNLNGAIPVAYGDASGTTSNGVLFTITFNVTGSASATDFEIICNEILDIDLDDATFELYKANVTLK